MVIITICSQFTSHYLYIPCKTLHTSMIMQILLWQLTISILLTDSLEECEMWGAQNHAAWDLHLLLAMWCCVVEHVVQFWTHYNPSNHHELLATCHSITSHTAIIFTFRATCCLSVCCSEKLTSSCCNNYLWGKKSWFPKIILPFWRTLFTQ